MGPALRAASIAAMLLALPVGATAPCKVSESDYEGSCAQAIDRFAWEVLVDWEVQTLDATRRLGRLVEEQVRIEPNELVPGETVELRTFVFDGLRIEGRNDGGTIRAHRIEIEKAMWRVRGGLGVGSSVEAIRKALGSSARQDGSVLSYQGMTEQADFTIRSGRVARIVVLFYTG